VKRSSCVLGIDLGTSAIKLVAISLEGRIIATAREPYGTITTCLGQAEQDCEHWLEAVSRAAKKVRSRTGREFQVDAIALTGQMPTLVVLRKGEPAAPAITWQDSRADGWVSERVDRDLRREIYLRTGILIDGRYLAPMFQFHHASRQKRPDFILSAKDFLFHALTGVAATDPSTASGYGLYNLRSKSWDAELCRLWGVSEERLPAIESSSFSAPLSPLGSKMLGCTPGTPVVLGCADSAAGVFAVNGGEQSTQTAAILTGSSTVIMKCDSEPRWDPEGRYLVTPLALDGTYGREADLLASGSARQWAENVFLRRANKQTQHSIWQAAYDVAPGADGLLFAPYLAGGEQGVLWNPELSGMLVGLTLAHNGAHIARAMLEGMSFEIRRCLGLLEGNEPVPSVRLAGWIADIPEEVQILADILGRPVQAFRLESASAAGAALVTGSIDTKKYSVRTKSVQFSAGEHSQLYNEAYARYVARFPTRRQAQ
jgi:xylulokinase